jgi:hypothetical protein
MRDNIRISRFSRSKCWTSRNAEGNQEMGSESADEALWATYWTWAQNSKRIQNSFDFFNRESAIRYRFRVKKADGQLVRAFNKVGLCASKNKPTPRDKSKDYIIQYSGLRLFALMAEVVWQAVLSVP